MGRPPIEYFAEFRLMEDDDAEWQRLSEKSTPLPQAEFLCKKRFDQCSYATGRKIEFRLVNARSGSVFQVSQPPHAWRLAWKRPSTVV